MLLKEHLERNFYTYEFFANNFFHNVKLQILYFNKIMEKYYSIKKLKVFD